MSLRKETDRQIGKLCLGRAQSREAAAERRKGDM